jgi:hypothetical protein
VETTLYKFRNKVGLRVAGDGRAMHCCLRAVSTGVFASVIPSVIAPAGHQSAPLRMEKRIFLRFHFFADVTMDAKSASGNDPLTLLAKVTCFVYAAHLSQPSVVITRSVRPFK